MKIIEDGNPERDIPSILYKYRDWKTCYHSDLLKTDEVYFASPKDCNDPFDCRITANFIQRSKDELEAFANDMASAHRYDPEMRGKDFQNIFDNFKSRLFDVESFQDEMDKSYFNDQDKYYGILSLSKFWDSILMWSHYSNNHKGFCVGIKGMSITKWFNDKAKGGGVNYENDFPDMQPQVMEKMSYKEFLERSFTETHTKAKGWCYEGEYRVLKNNYPELLINRKDYLPPNSIEEIILGIAISNEDKKEILEIAEKKNINVYQAKKIPQKFKMTREQIFFAK